MSRKKKLLQRILNKPKDLRFEELEKAILYCGYTLVPTKGSHAVYTRPDSAILTIPRKTPVKSYLIQQVLNAIEDCIEDCFEEML